MPRRAYGVCPRLGLPGTVLLLSFCFVWPSVAWSQEWRIEPDPVFSVGGLTEDPDYVLSAVQGGLVLADGRVVILDRAVNGLRVYSPQGVFLFDVGGSGEGPGEYEYVRGVDRCNGAPVVVFDLHWQMNLYDEDLTWLEERSSLLPGLGGTPYAFDCGSSGHWAATGWGNHEEEFRPGYYRSTAPVLLGIGDRVIRDFGERLSSERIGTTDANGTPTGSGPHPFGGQTSVAIGLDRVFIGDGSQYRIEAYDFDGSPLPAVEWDGPDREITRRHLQVFRDQMMETAGPGQEPAFRRWLQDLPRVEQFPAYDELLVDETGNLWVRYFQRPGDSTLQWVIFDTAGAQIGRLRLPITTSLLQPGADRVLVVERDELDVATVRLLRILR